MFVGENCQKRSICIKLWYFQFLLKTSTIRDIQYFVSNSFVKMCTLQIFIDFTYWTAFDATFGAMQSTSML